MTVHVDADAMTAAARDGSSGSDADGEDAWADASWAVLHGPEERVLCPDAADAVAADVRSASCCWAGFVPVGCADGPVDGCGCRCFRDAEACCRACSAVGCRAGCGCRCYRGGSAVGSVACSADGFRAGCDCRYCRDAAGGSAVCFADGWPDGFRACGSVVTNCGLGCRSYGSERQPEEQSVQGL